jgi:hypothetical protein
MLQFLRQEQPEHLARRCLLYASGASMFDRILQRMRAKVRTLDYVMTLHAEEEMEDDGLSILDVEHIILIGEIIERQREQETRE